jgi:hypothetical protein
MKKMFFLMLTLLLMGAAGMNAQVNIGSDDEPKKGAVLDLSQSALKLGLILPNVSLNDSVPFQLDGGSTGSDAAGTVVYNTNASLPNGVGIYVWDGSKWFAAQSGTFNKDGIVFGGAKDYSASAKGDVAKDWTTATNDELKGNEYGSAPVGVDAGNLMVSEFVYSSNDSVSSKSPSSGVNAYANLSTLSSGITWADAVKKCANLNEAGFSDWYLPNSEEIVRLSLAGYLGFFSVAGKTAARYWSSTEQSNIYAWYVVFSSNTEMLGLPPTYTTKAFGSTSSGTAFARCVRRF